MNHYILNDRFEPVREPDLVTWALWMDAASNPRDDGQSARHVAVSLRGEPGKEVRISTVFLGSDHGWHGRPELYETMIFGQSDYGEEYCERYATRAEAVAGHALAVELAEALIEANGEP